MRDFYVDDGLTSVESTKIAIQLDREARKLLCQRWYQTRLVYVILPTERATHVKQITLVFNDLSMETALDIQWDIESDHLSFTVNLKEQHATAEVSCPQ